MKVRVINARRGKLRLAFGVTLTPGVNEVSAADWVRCREHPVTLHYVGRSEVAVLESAAVVTPSVGTTGKSSVREASGSDTATQYNHESPLLPLPEGGAPGQVHPISSAPDAPSISEMKAKEAIGFVSAIEDVGHLKQVLSLEGRSTVIRAVERRLAEIGG